MAKKKTTALAKRPKKVAAKKAPAKKASPLPENKPATEETIPVRVVAERQLGDGVNIDDLGLVTFRLTPEEEAKMNAPVDIDTVRIKPDGAVYLPHYVYTRKLNEVFGWMSWQMVPAARPQIVNGIVSMPFRLHINGKPVAFAWGEQEYHPSNKNQTYGDAIEATMGPALRRCCKHFGYSLELWDSSFGEMFKAEYCVEVKVKANRKQADGSWKKEDKFQWRRQADPPFYNEVKGGSGRRDDDDDWQERRQREAPPMQPARRAEPQRAALPPATAHAHSDAPISDAQRQRLWAIARGRGRADEETRAYIKAQGYERSEAIRRNDYDRICTALQSPGALPL